MRSLIFRPRTWIVAAIVSWACPAFAQDPPTAAVVHIYSTRETVPASNTLKTSGLGAGFFITEDGDLLTAYHVIQGAVDVSIYTASGTECAGPKVVAYRRAPRSRSPQVHSEVRHRAGSAD